MDRDNVKWLILLLITPLAFGDNGNGNNQHSDTGAASVSGSGSTSSADAISRASFTNFLYVAPVEASGGGGTDRSINIKHGDYPANSAASLSLVYCTQGLSAQSKLGGIAVGGSDPVCRQTRMIGAALPHIERLKLRGQHERSDALFEDVTFTIERMFDDEKDRRKADQSFILFKSVGPWLLLILLF